MNDRKVPDVVWINEPELITDIDRPVVATTPNPLTSFDGRVMAKKYRRTLCADEAREVLVEGFDPAVNEMTDDELMEWVLDELLVMTMEQSAPKYRAIADLIESGEYHEQA